MASHASFASLASFALLAALPTLASAYAMVALLWFSLIAFAVLGGADFGAGIWDLLAFGRDAEGERGALIRAIGPIWEANEIWLIFLITGLFTAFPIIFSTLSVALFFPVMIALIGTVMRGASFAYYSHFRQHLGARVGWGRVFSIFSVIAPFFYGVMAGTVASAHIQAPNGVVTSDFVSTWLRPFPLACGAYAVAMCALLAAVYMVVETRNTGDENLVRQFRARALIAYAVTGALGLVAGLLAAFDAPFLWSRFVARALIPAGLTALAGIATAALLWFGFPRLARAAVAATVGGIFLSWGVAQFPYLIPPDLSIQNTASPPSVMGPLFISTLIGMTLLLPSLWFMLYLFKARHRPQPHPSAEEYEESLAPAPEPLDVAGGLGKALSGAGPTTRLTARALAVGVFLGATLAGMLGVATILANRRMSAHDTTKARMS
ncbi:MAG TPA: cytochrome d ubiquinol oxidase subunit II [Ktedonobacterales bacterium]|nr:cytochrome d ubiquinol oxidase subunit II [Ktedonobacterales bacterium]